ncbi:hypothetical protein J1605_009906 [Eschrichtius robustus]|uniref:Uncharacterized protein n=1 Tax=Eschrichtius robustus TaxID=9764 RepID=A0AB34GUT8_ESCRO|nr:hypothetical protein J1605_009906 [Eschrichtius robustus]
MPESPAGKRSRRPTERAEPEEGARHGPGLEDSTGVGSEGDSRATDEGEEAAGAEFGGLGGEECGSGVRRRRGHSGLAARPARRGRQGVGVAGGVDSAAHRLL